MYRGGRTQKPVSNPREHIQRNQYARTTLQKRKLFHTPRTNKRKFSYLAAACFAIGSIFYWGSFIRHQNKPVESPKQHFSAEHHEEALPIDPDDRPKHASLESAHQGIHEEAHPIDPDDGLKHTSLESAPYDEFKCSFREYKPHRYYPVHDITEKFLSAAEYIRGELPFVINPRTLASDGETAKDSSFPKKLCTDTSEWEKVLPDHRPFSDGQNPSFVSLAHDAYGKVSNHPRIEKLTIKPLADIYGEESLENLYLGLILFGDSQCRWNMTEEELKVSKLSPLQKAPSKRSLVVIINEHLDPIGRAVLELEHDARGGIKEKNTELRIKWMEVGMILRLWNWMMQDYSFIMGVYMCCIGMGPHLDMRSKFKIQFTWKRSMTLSSEQSSKRVNHSLYAVEGILPSFLKYRQTKNLEICRHSHGSIQSPQKKLAILASPVGFYRMFPIFIMMEEDALGIQKGHPFMVQTDT